MPPPTRPLLVQVLGTVALKADAVSIDRFRARKVESLLAYLAVRPGVEHSRGLLAELLWPDLPQSQGKNNLRVTLSWLKSCLASLGSGDALQANRQTVFLNAEFVKSDAESFEILALRCLRGEPSENNLAAAVSAYGGPFARGIEEMWATAERDRLSRLYVRCLRRLARLRSKASDHNAAIRHASAAVKELPLDEPAVRTLLMVLAAAGRDEEILDGYAAFCANLHDAGLGEPSAELRQVAVQLGSSKSKPRTGVRVNRHPKALLTPFVGREAEIEALHGILAGEPVVPLVTLIAPGGMGKTRLAKQYLALHSTTYDGRCWFADFQELNDPKRMSRTISLALGVGETEQDPIALLKQRSAMGPCLIVLDNVERLLELDSLSVQKFLDLLVSECPCLRVLATSRLPIHLPFETRVSLGPLPVPSRNGDDSKLAESPAIQLFASWLKRRRPLDTPSEEDLTAIAEICRRLDGMPLAIELAASWGNSLSPTQILEGLSDRFALLIQSTPEFEPRHRGLRTLLEAATERLPPESFELLSTMSVARGEFDIELVQALVAGPGEHPFVRTAAAFSVLLDRGLVARCPRSEHTHAERFRMFESVSELLRPSLSEHDFSTAMLRLTSHLSELYRFATGRMGLAQHKSWLGRAKENLQNALMCLAWLEANGSHSAVVELVDLTRGPFARLGHTTDLRQALDRILRSPQELDRRSLARAHLAHAQFAMADGDFEVAVRGYSECIPELRMLEDFDGLGEAFNNSFRLDTFYGKYEAAEACAKECYELAERMGDPVLRTEAVKSLAHIYRNQKRFREAELMFLDALSSFRALGNLFAIAETLSDYSYQLILEDRVEEAEKHANEALTLSIDTGDRKARAAVLWLLGNVFKLKEEFVHAERFYSQGLELQREMGAKLGIIWALGSLGDIYLKLGDTRRARDCFEERLPITRAVGDTVAEVQTFEFLAEAARLDGNDEEFSAYLAMIESVSGQAPAQDL